MILGEAEGFVYKDKTSSEGYGFDQRAFRTWRQRVWGAVYQTAAFLRSDNISRPDQQRVIVLEWFTKEADGQACGHVLTINPNDRGGDRQFIRNINKIFDTRLAFAEEDRIEAYFNFLDEVERNDRQ